jgi:hypothetical protein
MSINEKKINNNNKNKTEKDNKTYFYSFSSQNQDSFSEINSKKNYINDEKKITILPTTFQTLSKDKLEDNNDENENTLGDRLKDIYQNSLNEDDLYSKKTSKKPRLSLKESRTKLKQLREKLYPLSEEERIIEQEQLLPVPLELMNDEKFKILRMHNLKRPSLPEYKSCEKYENYYKPFEDSLNKRNEFYLLKKKKAVYSNTKFMKLEINLKNKNREKKFPLYKDQDIGIYEYWQVPLIENKIDEDNDSDEEQINLAKKVCEMDLMEGIKYIQKNGMESLINNKFKNKKEIENESK